MNTFRRLISDDNRPFGKTLTYLLDCEGWTKSRVAREAGVDLSMVTRTFSGDRQSRRVEYVVCCALGFDPWEIKMEN
jgi:lambda repressor-like predicted transcriptional regulator